MTNPLTVNRQLWHFTPANVASEPVMGVSTKATLGEWQRAIGHSFSSSVFIFLQAAHTPYAAPNKRKDDAGGRQFEQPVVDGAGFNPAMFHSTIPASNANNTPPPRVSRNGGNGPITFILSVK